MHVLNAVQNDVLVVKADFCSMLKTSCIAAGMLT